MNQQAYLISTNHREIIHDISFNQEGNRFATCSSDNRVLFYEKDSTGSFVVKQELRPHDGPVWKVKWAHQQFGPIIATCGHDKSVRVWQEKVVDEITGERTKEWQSKTNILETKENVVDIKFGCRKMGLFLAIAYSDGVLLFYDINQQNLSDIRQNGNVLANQNGLKCISWNKNQFDISMLAIGANDIQNRYKKPLEFKQDSKNSRINPQLKDCLMAENPGQVNTLTIMGFDKEWETFKTFDYIKETINDVSWASLNGRSFHLLAIADINIGVRVIKFTVNQKKIEILQMMDIDQYQGIAWRVCWNLLATTLTASFEKQELRVYQNRNNKWICRIQLEEQQKLLEL